ncbi:hypothetical protein DERF_009722 [Dermatophagoides farinae]|uniref:Uncharacterized protein n=1 Tax=Dermatophagoides farinae TaxID=6954 RepID=A0A922L2U4_DERFA|nr:hypothetical protein DERF_009722 [Dermatophagoides farinae]
MKRNDENGYDYGCSQCDDKMSTISFFPFRFDVDRLFFYFSSKTTIYTACCCIYPFLFCQFRNFFLLLTAAFVFLFTCFYEHVTVQG